MGDGSCTVFSYSPRRPLRLVPAILLFAIPTILFTFFLPGGVFGADPARWPLIMMFAAFLGFWVLELAWTFTKPTVFTVGEQGIEARSPTGHTILIKWEDVQSAKAKPVHIYPLASCATIIQSRDQQKKIVFYGDLTGYEELKAMVFERTGTRPG